MLNSRQIHQPRPSMASAARLLGAGLLAAALLAPFAASAPASAQDGQITVRDIRIATQLANGEPVEPGTSFSASSGQRLYAVVRVLNQTGAEVQVRIGFEAADGPERRGPPLTIPARRSRPYRTVARSTTARPPGRYRVVVRTMDGTVLQSADFTITE